MSSATIEPGTAPAVHDDVALFHRTLAELARSEVPLPRALRMLEADLSRGRLKDSAAEIAEEVESGVPFTEAYARREDTFPRLYRSLVAAGEASGDLPGLLEQIAGHASLRAEAAHRMRRALAYPIVTALFVLVLGLGVLVAAMPSLWRLPYEMGAGGGAILSPWGKSASLFFDPMTALGIGLGALAIFVGIAFAVAWWKSPLDFMPGFRLPVLGALRLSAARASLASGLALLLGRRTPLPTALELMADAQTSRDMEAKVRAMAARAGEGQGLAETLRSESVFSPSLLWLVESAEGTESSTAALRDVAAIYRRRLDRGLDRLTVLVTPLAELLIGIVVFFFAISFLLPLMEYANLVFRPW